MSGSEVGAYRVERRLGMGGMAVVYLVEHKRLGTLHALKMLDRRAGTVQERLLLEGKVQAALKHPNIVDVTDIIDVDGQPGLILEYVHGFHLGEFLEQIRPNTEQIDALAQGVLTGVRVAHQAGLVHRDLKPANILLQITGDGLIPKVADFGLAKSIDQSPDLTHTGHAMGTPAYMAPEQIRDAKNVDQRADLFSLGAILYEIVSGQRAFIGDSSFEIHQKICAGEFPPLEQLVPDLPERMADAIEKALVVDPDERVPSCDRLLALWTGVDEVTSDGPWDAGALREVQDQTAVAPTLTAVPIARDDRALSVLIEAAESRRAFPVSPSGTSLPMRAARSVPVRALGAVGMATALVAVGWFFGQESSQDPPPPVEAIGEPPSVKPDPVAKPEPEPEVAPAPEPDVLPAATSPAPSPRPPAPRPLSRPEPEPEPEVVATGSVFVTGDAAEVMLVRGDERLAPGDAIPVGTYEVHARFQGSELTHALDILVLERGLVTIACDSGFMRCAVSL